MGVLTTGYSIPAKLMRKIRADHENLAYVLGYADEETLDWIIKENPDGKIDDYDFDKGFADIISVLERCGYRKAYELLDGERYFYSENGNYIEYEGYQIWFISPAKVKFIVKEIETITLAKIKAAGDVEPLRDYYNNVIPESMYENYLGYIEDMNKFVKKVADNGNYLLFAEA